MLNIQDKWKIYCPSYKRSDLAISHKLFEREKFCYVVRNSEAELYREKFPDVEIMPIMDESITNLLQTRHYILKNKNTPYCIQVDDDMTKIQYIKNDKQRTRYALNSKEITMMINKGYTMAEDLGTGLWGINCQSDPKFYQQIKPFSLSNVILGPFLCYLDDQVFSDERLYLKEDYDLFMQMMRKYRKVLRFNMYSYVVDHQKMAGGCQTYRKIEIEDEQNKILLQKWGSDFVKKNWKSKDSINMIIKMPI